MCSSIIRGLFLAGMVFKNCIGGLGNRLHNKTRNITRHDRYIIDILDSDGVPILSPFSSKIY